MKKVAIGISLIAALMQGCGTTKVGYREPTSSMPLTTDFTYTDLTYIAEDIVESMLVSPATQSITRERRPLLLVERVRNKTDQHIETEAITDTIRTKLIRSGKFRFTDKVTRGAQMEELEYQNHSGMVSKGTATRMGEQYGAEYILTGSITSFEERSKKEYRKAYKFNLNLINLQSGVIEWADEVPIGKQAVRKGFGY